MQHSQIVWCEIDVNVFNGCVGQQCLGIKPSLCLIDWRAFPCNGMLQAGQSLTHALNHGAVRGCNQTGYRLCIGQCVFQFLGRQARVQCHFDQAEFVKRAFGHHDVGTVGRNDGNSIAFLQAQGLKCMGHLVGLCFQFPETQSLIAKNDCGFVRPVQGTACGVNAKVHVFSIENEDQYRNPVQSVG